MDEELKPANFALLTVLTTHYIFRFIQNAIVFCHYIEAENILRFARKQSSRHA